MPESELIDGSESEPLGIADATAPGDRSPTRRARRWAPVIAAVAVLLTFGGAALVTRQPGESGNRRSFPDANVPFPSETASDVVSYSDHVLLVTAIAEEDLPQSEYPTAMPTATGGERTILRRVTFRVDAPLWSRSDAPTAPTEFSTVWYGWLQRGRKRVPYVTMGTPWVFVGGQYVMPIALDGEGYRPLQYRAVFRFDRGVVTPETQDSALAKQLSRASRDLIVDVFARAVPDPLAVRFGHLPPRDRLNAVVATRRG